MLRPIALASSLLLAAAAAGGPKEKPLNITAPDQKVVGPMNLAGLNRLGLAALTGTPGRLGGFVYAFDRRLDTHYEAQTPGPAHIDMAFARPQLLQSVRLNLGEGTYRWSLSAAESAPELDRAAAVRVLVPERDKPIGESWDEVRLPTALAVKALRLSLVPTGPGRPAVIRECNLITEQSLEALSITAKSAALPIGELVPLEVAGYFSGGDLRPLTGKGLKWTVTPPTAASMREHNYISARRKGPLQVTVTFGKLVSPPLLLEAVD